jgi:hypothetical protein
MSSSSGLDVYIDPTFDKKSGKVVSIAKVSKDVHVCDLAPTKRPLHSSTVCDKTVEAIELNNLLNEIGISDMDDSTINTRVARKEIDDMFCSPGDNSSPIHRSRFTRYNSDKFRALSIGELSDIREV